MARKQVMPLMEWRSGIPPQGRYLLDTGRVQCPVNVRNGEFEWCGTVHPLEYAYKIGKLLGPIARKETENMGTEVKEVEKKRGRPAKAEVIQSDNPAPSADIDAETDAQIRAALLELAEHPFMPASTELAAKLIDRYGDEIGAARKSKRGWRTIAGVFKRHGVTVGAKALRTRVEIEG
jgi:hypothetical protein